MNKSESIVKIASALVKAQSEMGNAVKDSKNPFFKSKYADLNSVREACIPALNKNGISVLQPTSVVDGKLYVETLLLHESGEFISGLYEVIAAKQNDPQSLGSSITYARRYGLQAMVNIGAEDDDGQAAVTTKVDKTDEVANQNTNTTVEEKQISKYNFTWVVEGNSFPIREELKKRDFRFDKESKVWYIESNDDELVLDLDLRGCKLVRLENEV